MSRLNPTGAPPEAKWVVQSNTTIFVVIVSYVLTVYVFKGDIPVTLQAALPGLCAWVLGALAGWGTRHTPRLDEVVRVVAQAQQRVVAEQAAQLAQQPAPTQTQAPAAPRPRIEEQS